MLASNPSRSQVILRKNCSYLHALPLSAAVLGAFLAISLPARTAHAIAWTGATSTNWATGSNWVGGVGPVNTTDTATFSDTGSINLPNEVTSVLNNDRTIAGLTFNNTAGKFHTLDLGLHTLTVNGNLNLNVDQPSATTTTVRNGTLTLTGAFSTLNVGRAVSGSANGTADFSGLTALTATIQDVNIATSTSGAATGTLTLSPANSITTQHLFVGASNNSSETRGTLHLGLNNTILANEFTIGKDNSFGVVDIVNNGSLNLGSVSQRTLLQIANQTTNTLNTYTGSLNLSNAAVNLYLDSLIVGQKNGGPGAATGQFLGGGSGMVSIGNQNARGTWLVGYALNGGNAQGTVDFSRLNTLQAYVTDFFIGKIVSGTASGTVSLAASNTINASGNIVVGSGGGATLTLGATNTFLANQFIIGQDYSSGLVQISSGGTLNLGSSTNRAALIIGNQNTNTQNTYTPKLDLTGATFNAYLSDLIVGQKDGGPGAVTANLLGGAAGSLDIGAPGNTANVFIGRSVNGGNASGIVDLRGINTLTASLNTLSVGTTIVGTAFGNLQLGANNNINATNIVVGSGSATGTLALGLSNTILANQLTIGQDYSVGSVTIASGGSLALGSPAQKTNVSIGVATTNTNNTYSGSLDLTNATFIAYLDNVIVGNKNAQPGAEQGTFTISNLPTNYIEANTITLGGNQSTGTLNYGGGTFYAGTIQKGAGTANFNWTGGTLSVNNFGAPATPFNLANSGTGTLAPGSPSNPVGTTNVFGNYTQGNAANTAIDIQGVSPGTGNDLLAVTGAATFAGNLNLTITGGFTPVLGQNLVIATYASRTGTYAFVAPPHMPETVAFQLEYSPTQLLVHMVAPTPQNWTATNGTFGTAVNWNTNSVPVTTSNLTIDNSTVSLKTITVLSSTTVHRISLNGAASSAATTLEVPQGIKLGVANQLVVGPNAILSGGGQVLGDVVLAGGTLASFGTIAGNVTATSTPSTIAPSQTLSPSSHSTLIVKSLTTNANTVLKFNLTSPGASSVNDLLVISSPNDLDLDGASIEIPNHPTGLASLGYYKIIQYTGNFTPSLANITLPAVANNVAYSLDAATFSGFVSLHRGYLGDANDDGTVNFADFVQLSNHYGQSNQGWLGADFNNDGQTNFADFVILSNNYGQSISGGAFTASADELAFMRNWASAPLPTPEPGTLSTLLGGANLLLTRRRSRIIR